MIILDFGSGNSCQNDVTIVKRMIDELVKVDTGKHTVVIKWQLFTDCPPNEPLRRDVFDYAYNYAKEKGYQTTASVFDMDSLQFLLTYDIPFVKIANRPDLYWLECAVPLKIPVYKSVTWGGVAKATNKKRILCCISEYPAEYLDYIVNFTPKALSMGISDHTTDFTLYHKYKPEIYECHYRLADSTGPDAGDFARLPSQLAEVL